MTHAPHIEIYTDGACIGNPGPGGFGVVILEGREWREHSGGFRKTTNNRMEIMGAIVGLQAMKERASGVLYSDSLYLVKGIEKGWARGWRERNWMRTRTERAINSDLWATLLELHERHDFRFKWVKGHAANRENNRCDELATTAARNRDLPLDAGYESVVSAARDPSLFET